MDPLKLIAFDADDLQILSAHLQDAIVRVGEMKYLPRERRFAAVLNRFDWATAHAGDGKDMMRRQAALRFERVLAARTSGIDLARQDEALVLLAVGFEASGEEDPSGTMMLMFAGDAAIQLEVECIEAELRDLGPVWRAELKPEHSLDAEPGPGKPGR